MMSASPVEARRAATLPKKPPPQFHRRTLAPRWLPRRQACAGEGGEEAGASLIAAAVLPAAAAGWLSPATAMGGDLALGGLRRCAVATGLDCRAGEPTLPLA